MDFNPSFLPWPSRRYPVYAPRGMVASSQNLATRAGLRMLEKGGNAVDAALATAICLTVVEPTSNGLGGDGFALVWARGALHGFNGSGPAPEATDAEALRAAGRESVPLLGWAPVTVPGVVGLWELLSRRFGQLQWKELFEPAIAYAAEGFPVSPVVARGWDRAFRRYAAAGLGELVEPWMRTFAPEGRAPAAGETARLPDHAATLRAIAEGGADEFYCGAIAERADRFSRATGGALRAADLAAYSPLDAPPLATRYRGHEVHELPPNGQGLVALLALAILERRRLAAGEGGGAAAAGSGDASVAARQHEEIEAVKLAFRECRPRLGDPAASARCAVELLEAANVARLAAEIGGRALVPAPAAPLRGGTVYLASASRAAGELVMVSYIQSNYMGFGSGLVVPGTGVALQNRGACFSLEPGHPNALGPGRRSFHTIIPGFLTRAGQPVGPFGVMGGHMQPQGHVQLLDRLLAEGLNPQAALDAPRWQWVEGRRLLAEREWPREALVELADRGHAVELSLEDGEFGRGQCIIGTDGGAFCAGTEPRADSLAVGL